MSSQFCQTGSHIPDHDIPPVTGAVMEKARRWGSQRELNGLGEGILEE